MQSDLFFHSLILIKSIKLWYGYKSSSFGAFVLPSQSIYGTSERNIANIRDMENVSTITAVTIPSQPTTKPFKLYRSREFSQILSSTPCVTSSTSSFSLGNDKSFVDNYTLQQDLNHLHGVDYS